MDVHDYWLPAEDRYEKARPKAAWPTQTFFNTGSMKAGGEQIDYGYLVSAHTGGDIYVISRIPMFSSLAMLRRR